MICYVLQQKTISIYLYLCWAFYFGIHWECTLNPLNFVNQEIEPWIFQPPMLIYIPWSKSSCRLSCNIEQQNSIFISAIFNILRSLKRREHFQSNTACIFWTEKFTNYLCHFFGNRQNSQNKFASFLYRPFKYFNLSNYVFNIAFANALRIQFVLDLFWICPLIVYFLTIYIICYDL